MSLMMNSKKCILGQKSIPNVLKCIATKQNIRVQKYLRDYLVSLTEELKRLEQIDQSTDVLENIKYLLTFIEKLSPQDEGDRKPLPREHIHYQNKHS